MLHNFLFFKQKTAYEMRISDWSSDVCSSDLHDDVPSAVFSQPPIGSVGLTEAKAREKYGELDVYVSGFRPMKYTLTENTERGFMKLIVDRASQRVVGAHMLGVDEIGSAHV